MKNLIPWLVLAIAVIAYVVYNQNLITKIGTPSTVQEFSIESKNLHRNVKIWVYLPPNYLQSKEKLPVLYMHHGQNLFDEELSYAGEWQVDESLDKLHQEKGHQLVVVGIENGGEKRLDELTPFSHKKYGGGKANSYLNFITKELMPQVEQRFNVAQTAENRGMMGSSLGGLITFYTAFSCSDIFSKFGVYSPSFWFNDRIFTMAENQKLPASTRMLMMIGEKEENGHLNVQKMEKTLKNNQEIQLKTKYNPLGEHNEKYWSAKFKEDVAWLFFKE